MRVLAPLLENPWCLVLVVALVVLVFGAAFMVARAERAGRTEPGYPAGRYPLRRLAASAPLEALAALHAGLLDLQHRLPPGSDDARWLAWFTGRLRLVMDEAYERLETAPPAAQPGLLDRLAVEVEALGSAINLQLGATLSHGTDRQALEAQLAALRASLRSG